MTACRLIIPVVPRRHDTSGQFRLASENYARAFARAGLHPTLLETDGPDADWQAHLADPALRLVFGYGFWCLDAGDGLGRRRLDQVAARGVRMIMLFGDPPYFEHFAEALARLPSQAIAFFIDPSFRLGLERLCPSVVSGDYLTCCHEGEEIDAVDTAAKDIPLLFVGGYRDPAQLYQLYRGRRDLLPAIDGLIERMLDDHDASFIDMARHILPDHGLPLDLANRATRMVLQAADEFVRHHRRARMIERLLRHDALIVTDGPLRPPAGTRAKVVPPVGYRDLMGLLMRSRAVAVAQPAFAGAINERIVLAMQARAVVITQANWRVRERFTAGRHLLVTAPDLHDMDDVIALSADDRAMAGVRDQARDLVRTEFAVAGNVRHFLDALAM